MRMIWILLICLTLPLTGCSAFRELARQDREWLERHKNDPPSKKRPTTTWVDFDGNMNHAGYGVPLD